MTHTVEGPQRQHHAMATGKGLTPAPKGSTLSSKQSFGPGTSKGQTRERSGNSTGSSGKGGY